MEFAVAFYFKELFKSSLADFRAMVDLEPPNGMTDVKLSQVLDISTSIRVQLGIELFLLDLTGMSH